MLAKISLQYFKMKLGDFLDFFACFQCIVHDIFHLVPTAKLCSLKSILVWLLYVDVLWVGLNL